MKKIFLISFLFTIMIFCQSQKPRIQLLNDLDVDYKLLDGTGFSYEEFLTEKYYGNLIKQFEMVFSEHWNSISKIDGIFSIEYMFYVNEKGLIDKAKRLDIIYQPILPKIFINKIEPELLEKLSAINLWRFEKNGKKNKYRFVFGFNIGRDRNNKMTFSSSFSLDKFNYSNNFFSSKSVSNENVLHQDAVPKLLEMPIPAYPEDAKKAGLEGKVFIKVTVDEFGHVEEAVIVEGVSPSLNKAAVEAVKLANFKAGTKKNKPAKMETIIPIQFDLDK